MLTDRLRKLRLVATVGMTTWVLALSSCTDTTPERSAPAGGADTAAIKSPDGEASGPATPTDVEPFEPPPTRRHVNTEAGVPFSFKMPPYAGWERFGSISLNRSYVGPQDAEVIIYWSSFPDGDYLDYYGHDSAHPCTRLLSPPVGPSAADLAAAVSTAPGTELVAGPADVTVGGYPAKRVLLTVRKDVGCDPGFFYAWHDVYGGALWTTTPVGASMRVWIVDVGGTRLFIGAATSLEASYGLSKEIEQIVGSIRFD